MLMAKFVQSKACGGLGLFSKKDQREAALIRDH